jgi:hypothetical protein
MDECADGVADIADLGKWVHYKDAVSPRSAPTGWGVDSRPVFPQTKLLQRHADQESRNVGSHLRAGTTPSSKKDRDRQVSVIWLNKDPAVLRDAVSF